MNKIGRKPIYHIRMNVRPFRIEDWLWIKFKAKHGKNMSKKLRELILKDLNEQ